MILKLHFAFDFCPWSPVPWTSDVPESEFEIASKIRQFAAFTLQTEWDKQVDRTNLCMTDKYFQAPATHPTGVAVTGSGQMAPSKALPHIPFFASENKIRIKVRKSLSREEIVSTKIHPLPSEHMANQFEYLRQDFPTLGCLERMTGPSQ